MNPLKKLASQTAIYGLSSVVGRLLNYLLVPLYTRYFLPEEYGVVTELYAYVAFLVIILTYGLETAFFRFSQTEKNNRVVFSTSLISLLITSISFIILMFVFSDNIAERGLSILFLNSRNDFAQALFSLITVKWDFGVVSRTDSTSEHTNETKSDRKRYDISALI